MESTRRKKRILACGARLLQLHQEEMTQLWCHSTPFLSHYILSSHTSMASDVEPAKTFLLPYVQRADELQRHEPLVVYCCRLHAMERGLKIPVKERTMPTNQILVPLKNQWEKWRP